MLNRRATHILSSYYAPRGHNRMYSLGMQLAQQYLSPTDKLIGVIGEAGSEAVLPLENNTEWMDILAEKIGGNVTIPIVLDGKKIATYVVDIQKKKAFAMNGA